MYISNKSVFVLCKKSTKAICVALLLVLFSLSIRAQQFNFRNLSEASSSQCYCVLQDSKGFIWYSSDKGLYRYDGNTYTCFNNENGLAHNSVFQLCEDSKGRILFNTLQGKIGYIFHDSVFYPPLNGKLQKLLHSGLYIIDDLYVDTNHILWIATYHGLFKTQKPDDYSTIESAEPPVADSVHVIIKVIDGKKPLWYLCSSESKKKYAQALLYTLIDRDGKYFTFPYIIDKKTPFTSNFSAVLLTNRNILWSCWNMLFTIQPDGKFSIKRFESDIVFVYQDKEGGIWIGLHNKGVAYYKDNSLAGEPLYSLAGNSVSHIYEDAENGIWVTTLGGGAFYTRTKYVIDYTNHNELSSKINSVGIVNNKALVNNYNNDLYAANDSGIDQIAMPANYATAIYNYRTFGNSIYLTGVPWSLHTDSSLKRWSKLVESAAGRCGQLYDIAKSPSGKMYAVSFANLYSVTGDMLDTLGLLPSRGHSICATKSGELLIGCENGLYRYTDGNYTNITEASNMPSVSITVLKEDSNGNVWALTKGYGALIYRNGKITKTFSTRNGLASNFPSSIVFDNDGNTCIGTDNGISKIYPAKNYLIENFDTRDGFISNDITSLALENNKLWIGSGNGLCKADISLLKKNTVPPPVYIGSVFVNDSALRQRPDFAHNLNNFRFHLLAATYKDKNTRFSYRIIGFDSIWHTSLSPDVSFNNLTPGTYKFEAKAINADGIASISPAIFSFTILNPFWKTWWFILLEILSVGGLIYFFIKFRLNTIRQREIEKTRINKMVAEYQMTALRAQMNPHFIFNAINSIQQYVLDNEPQQAYDYLTKFAQLVRIVLNNTKEKTISLEKELETLQTYVQLEQLRFNNAFEFILDIDNNADLYNIHIPAMIIQPYVENAIWHGLMPLVNLRKGKLTVSIIQNGHELMIAIEDNGIGREKSALIKRTKEHKSMGMELTQHRLNMLNSLPEYTSSSITVNDLYDNSGAASGTRVEIKITTKVD